MREDGTTGVWIGFPLSAGSEAEMGLTRHGAHTFWGLLTRTAATIAAHTLVRACLAVA
jgi:hypothetical protein